MPFKKQKGFCMICGQEDLRDYSCMKNGSICGINCLQEWDWRYALFITGEDYRVDPLKMKGGD